VLVWYGVVSAQVIGSTFLSPENAGKNVDGLQLEKQRLVNNDHMAEVAAEALQLDKFMACDDIALHREVQAYMERAACRREGEGPKILADMFEALVAAVFIDAGGSLETVHDVLLPRLRQVPPEAQARAMVLEPEPEPEVVDLGMRDTQVLPELFPTLLETCRAHFPRATQAVEREWAEIEKAAEDDAGVEVESVEE
jgi:hypothetical protein